MLVDTLTHLVQGIVEHPDDVEVTEDGGRRRGTWLRVHVHPEDLGQVIGRQGRTARALRTVMTAVGGPDVRVDVVDPERGPSRR